MHTFILTLEKGMMKIKRITVFDFNGTDSGETAETVRRYYRLMDRKAEIAEFSDYIMFVYDYRDKLKTIRAYDMVFIGVDSMMGMEVARHIRELDNWCPMFLVSHVADYAMEGYRLHALHYLTKPISVENVKNAVERIGSINLICLQDPALYPRAKEA